MSGKVKTVKAWAVVHGDVLVREFENRRFDIYESRVDAQKVARLAIIPSTESVRAVRVEISEVKPRKRKLTPPARPLQS